MPSLTRTIARALVSAALVTTVAAVPAKSKNGEAIVKAMHHPTKEAACEMCKDSGRGAACYAGDCGDGSSEFCWVPAADRDADIPADYTAC